MLTRDQQIEFVENAEQRARGYLEAWDKDPRYIAALNRLRRREQPAAYVKVAGA